MRQYFAFAAIFAAALFIGSCATAPEQPQPQPTPVTPSPRIRSDLLGMTTSELVQRLGTPALQIREGPSLKLQFRASSCILDAYLYPPVSGQGPDRVTHVDTRLRSGADTDQTGCIVALEGA